MPLYGSAFTDHLVVVIAAFLIHAIFGGPRRFYLSLGLHLPGRLVTQLVRTLERKLNRERRAPGERQVRGTVLAVAMLMVSLLGAMLCAVVLSHFNFGTALEILLVASLLSFRPPLDRAQEVARALNDAELADARAVLEGTVWRNASLLDEHGVVRAVIETLAMSFASRVVAPLLWYVLLGLPGLFASRMLVLLHDLLAQTEAQQKSFGKATHLLWSWVMLVPHVVAGILLCAASLFSPTASPSKAFSALTQRMQTGTLDTFLKLPVPVMASASNVALGGPASVYAGTDWIGTGALKPGVMDMRRAVMIYLLAGVLLLVVLSLLAS